MFDRFYKADPARSKDSIRNGFGVGLSIARKAAQWHGGTIKAGPVGTDQICFTVTLRRKEINQNLLYAMLNWTVPQA